MAIPMIGDGAYVGDGNVAETLNVGVGVRPVKIGSSTGYVGFYGKTPVVQRPYSSAVHATAGLTTASNTVFVSTDFNKAIAALQEVQSTLIGLGIYATA